MAVFEGLLIVPDLTTSMKFKDKSQLRKDITSNGGIVSYIVTKKSTHVVCNDPEKTDVSYKCRMAAKYDLPVVSINWIKQCIEQNRILNTDDYLIAGKTKSDKLAAGKIPASKFQKTEKKKTIKPYINVTKFRVWSPGDDDCPIFTPEYQLAKYAIFVNEKKEKKAQMFTVLEIHVDDKYKHNNSVFQYKYRVTSHSGSKHQSEKSGCGSFEYRFCCNVDEVLAIYSYLYKQQQQQGMTLTHKIFSQNIGSEKFCQMTGELGIESCNLSDEVSQLVQHIWYEALGELETIISVPITNIKLEQIEKAEAVLKQIKSNIDNKDMDSIPNLVSEFYKNIPHNIMDSVTDNDRFKAWISRKMDTCQLVKDMISVSEATDWSMTSSTQSKYKALRCLVENLPKSCEEFQRVETHLMSSLTGNESMTVQSIYAVSRPLENVNFTHDIPSQELFHASKVNNIVGILSRGLLMPKVVVDDHGGIRSDPGMLGSGIYFANSASTSIQYSTPSKTKGSRFMLVCDVALGRQKEMYERDYDLTSPPEGYDSVHGVKTTEHTKSAFKDDEFVVYSTRQQRIKYLIEFTTDDDTLTSINIPLTLCENMELTDDNNNGPLSLTDVKDIVDPMSKVKAGLVSKDDAPVNLKCVHIRAKLMDLASEVIVLQEYENLSDTHLEAKYVFPLSDLAVVCGFEAFINGKHIIGEVKEKETAHKEYKKAISEGHGAYLMDQDEETPDVFTVSVGNLPPGATVLIKITYVAELLVEGELISFRLPGSVAPWKKDSLKLETQKETDTVEVEQGETSIQVSVDMPYDIRSIECPTHRIKSKRTLTKATIEMLPNQSISEGFHLYIGLAEIHVPRMWVERKPEDHDHQACMLTFYPEFEACDNDDTSVILMLDLSNSMKGDNLVNAKKILLLTLQQLPPSWNINIVVFGTAWQELFPTCVTNTTANRKLASEFIMNVTATMGNTEVIRPLHSIYLLKPENYNQNIFIISDGHLNNPDTMLISARDNSQHTRIFTFGIGATADCHLLRNLARTAAGAFEFFDSKAKSKWEAKVKSQIHKAAQPGLTSVSVHWEQHGADFPPPVQAPSQITALFNGSRVVIYGFVPNCTSAILKASIGGEEVETMVSASSLSITEGKILHRLTAKAVIGDWEDGVLSPDRIDHEIVKMNTKNFIIELSKEYSIVTQFTSFVAIEKRDKDDDIADENIPTLSELIDNVDELMYMEYKEDEQPKEPDQVEDSSSSSSSDDDDDSDEDDEDSSSRYDTGGMVEADWDDDSDSGEHEEEELPVLEGLRKLKNIAVDIGQEIENQSKLVDSIEGITGKRSMAMRSSVMMKKYRSRSRSRDRSKKKKKAKSVSPGPELDDSYGFSSEKMYESVLKKKPRPAHRMQVQEEAEPLMMAEAADMDVSYDESTYALDKPPDVPLMMRSSIDAFSYEEPAEEEIYWAFSYEKPAEEKINKQCKMLSDRRLSPVEITKALSVPQVQAEESEDEEEMGFGLFDDEPLYSPTSPTYSPVSPTYDPGHLMSTVGLETGKPTAKPDPCQPLSEKIPDQIEFYAAPLEKSVELKSTISKPKSKKTHGNVKKPQELSASTIQLDTFDALKKQPPTPMFQQAEGIHHGYTAHLYDAPPKPSPQYKVLGPDKSNDSHSPPHSDPQTRLQPGRGFKTRARPYASFEPQMSSNNMAIGGGIAQLQAMDAFPLQQPQNSQNLLKDSRPSFFGQPSPSSATTHSPPGFAPPPLQPAYGIIPPPPPPPEPAPASAPVPPSLRKSASEFAHPPPPRGGFVIGSVESSLPPRLRSTSAFAPKPPRPDGSAPPPPLRPLCSGSSGLSQFAKEPAQLSPVKHATSGFGASRIKTSEERLEAESITRDVAMAYEICVGDLHDRERGTRQLGRQKTEVQYAAKCGAVDLSNNSRERRRRSGLSKMFSALEEEKGKHVVEKCTSETESVDESDLCMYGIGVNVPSIMTSGFKLNLSDLDDILRKQDTLGFWVMDSSLQESLSVDFSVCITVLDKAGLKSLGTKCYEEIIQLVSTTVVLLCMIKCIMPDSLPINFRHQNEVEAVIKKLLETLFSKKFTKDFSASQLVFNKVQLAIEFCSKVDGIYPLVCSQLELGQNWSEFAGKMLHLHANISDSAADKLGQGIPHSVNPNSQSLTVGHCY
ncbi:Protein mono-ADP-ribosyltransferase parp4 [Mactra antiquata]